MASKKTDLLFIHGFRGSPDGLTEIAEAFPEFSVHTPSIPPAGGKVFDEYTVEAYAKFIADFIMKHNLHRPVLIGHSLGSIIAAATAERYPNLVNDKLILLAPISKKPAKFFGQLTPLTVVFPSRLVDYITTRYLFIPHDRELFKHALKITNNCAKAYRGVKKREIMKAGQFSAAHSTPEFKFKKDTLIIVGEKDRLIPYKYTKKYAEDIHAKLVTVKNTGHILNYENPKKVAEEIRRSI